MAEAPRDPASARPSPRDTNGARVPGAAGAARAGALAAGRGRLAPLRLGLAPRGRSARLEIKAVP